MFAIVGDGAFTMTCMEIFSATRLGAGLMYYVFHDGELSQIAQTQEIPFNGKPDTALGAVKTNFKRLPLAQRLRMVTRAVKRKITG